MQQFQSFDLEFFQNKINTFNWSDIDSKIRDLPINQFFNVQISDPQCLLMYQRFRSILQLEQNNSQRIFYLCNWLLKFKTNNYYALMVKKDYIFSLIQKLIQLNEFKYIINYELAFSNDLLTDNGKEYHIWTFKKDLLINVFKNQKISKMFVLQNFKKQILLKQLSFISQLLHQDCRNYHAWDYRFWIVTFFNYTNEQLQWTMELLMKGFDKKSQTQQLLKMLKEQGLKAQQMIIDWKMVNSLWSHRFNLLKYKYLQNLTQSQQNLSVQDIQFIFAEIKIIINFLIYKNQKGEFQNKKNQCIWSYLEGMIYYFNNDLSISSQLKIKLDENIKQEIQKSLFNELKQYGLFKYFISNQDQQQKSQNNKNIEFNRFQLSFLLKCLKLKIWNFQLKVQNQIQQKIVKFLQKIDPIRIKYYYYLKKIKNQQINI